MRSHSVTIKMKVNTVFKAKFKCWKKVFNMVNLIEGKRGVFYSLIEHPTCMLSYRLTFVEQLNFDFFQPCVTRFVLQQGCSIFLGPWVA